MSLSHFIIVIIIGFISCNLTHITTLVLTDSFPDKLSKSVAES